MRSYAIASIVLAIVLCAGNTCFGQYQNQYGKRGNAREHAQSQQNPQRASSTSSVSCPERNGRFPVTSQCDAYIECIDGVGEEKLCPEGLLFNPDERFNYPCGYPIDVDCGGRAKLQAPQPTEQCPHRYGYFKIGDRSNCGKFVNCADGIGYEFDCPEGLAFNPRSYRCDWPDQVEDCDAEAFLGFKCSSVDNNSLNFGADTRLYRSPTDCQRFFVCVNGRPRLQNCGAGNAFNELTNACDAAENVTGCEPPFQAEEPTGRAAVAAGRRTRLF